MKLDKIIFFLLLLWSSIAFGQSKVTVYSYDFSGTSGELGVGRYDYTTLLHNFVTNVGSLRIPEGMKVTIYEKDNFHGESIELTEDASMDYLQAKGFGQVTQNVSLVVAVAPPVTGPVAIIYKDNYLGSSKKLVPGYYDYLDLGKVGNDQLSSVKVPKGMKVTLYENKESGGRSLVLTADAATSFLTTNKFNDLTSSIEVELLPEPEPAPAPTPVPVPVPTPVAPEPTPAVIAKPEGPYVTIFQGDYSGLSQNLKPGRYDTDALGIGNDELSSVKMPRGFRVTLYEHSWYEGRSLVLTQNSSAGFLDDNEFNNQTSSIFVEALPVITIYQGNFSGNSKSFEAGRYNRDSLGIGGDEISSVKVPSGLRVTLYQDRNFHGSELTLTQDADATFLSKNDFNNVTSSMVVDQLENVMPMVTLYEDDFAGPMKSLPNGKYDTKFLSIRNDELSSINIPRGFKVTLYENGAFEGRALELKRPAPTALLIANNFNNVTSSMVVSQIPPADLVVTIFRDSYSGSSQSFTPGRYTADNLAVGNDQLSSVRVPTGMRAILYENNNFTGRSVTLEANADFTGIKSFNDQTSSIVVEDIISPQEIIQDLVDPVVSPANPVVTPAVIETPVAETVAPDRVEYSYDKPCGMSDEEYAEALTRIDSKPFSDEKMEMVRLVTKDKCLTNEQIRAIAKRFSFEEQTLEFVKVAYNLASEKDRYYTLDDVFKFMSSKAEFAKFLNLQSDKPSSPKVKTVAPPTIPNLSSAPAKPVSNSSSTENAVLKKEALDFALKLIGTYFTQDCNTFFSYLSQELISFDRGNVLITDEIRSKLCESVKKAVTNKNKTLADYLATYKVELLTRVELEAKVGRALPDHFNTTDEQLFFIGHELKSTSTQKFIWDDMFLLVLRKTNGVWKMKGSLGG